MEDGEVPAKEYDYLLTMPLWSLSEEKVAELNRQLDEKKDDHDELDATHIHVLWERDLDALLEALDKQEAIDECDRLAHKGKAVGSGGGKKARRKAKPAAKDEEAKIGGTAKGGKAAAGKGNKGPNAAQQEIVKKRQPGAKPTKTAPKKITAAKEPEAASQPAKEPAELSLRERLALRAQGGADKIPAQTNPLYDELRGMGKGLSGAGVDILKGDVGRKRRKGDSSDSE